MKERTLLFSGVVASLALFFGMMIYMDHQQTKAVEAVNVEWRKASTPVFEARHVPRLAQHATPRDLSEALDATSVLTYPESYKWLSNWEGKNGGTKIVIASADQEWYRAK